ncbi:DUF1361 domain-containing protein [Ancylothrix sp. C2]|uniref:DUF1361 domain-containing protein n=1 Tax=Ancylothrix sp. D3o TaxID=2953691 RepID=UPI0021BB4AE5|nr:DUF1361 domain-containing protein [Ancylothrix sp. D3o]MCT7952111.1 DUF1361 domain-containing protein [Ancylothrix sp. D3o]
MTAQLLNWFAIAWQAMAGNGRFMTWNLFLALVPLALSFLLFHRPRSPILRYGVWLLLGATFLPSTYHVFHYLLHLIRDVGKTYLLGALVFTLIFMALDIFLMRRLNRAPVSRSLVWWVGFFAFVAFLPNAPYVLTDIIHLIDDIRQGYSVWIITLALVPQYLLFMGAGFFAYVLSLINLGEYLKKQGWQKFIVSAEIILHALTAIGIYLGRFIRFNSWDIVTNPDDLVVTITDDLVGKRPLLVMIVTFVIIAGLYWLMKLVTLGIIERQNKYQNSGNKPSHPDSTPAS